jgi:hypothetical protein
MIAAVVQYRTAAGLAGEAGHVVIFRHTAVERTKKYGKLFFIRKIIHSLSPQARFRVNIAKSGHSIENRDDLCQFASLQQEAMLKVYSSAAPNVGQLCFKDLSYGKPAEPTIAEL